MVTFEKIKLRGMMIDSEYQKDIYKTLQITNSNITIQATAGSGKTTTIVNACRYLPYGKKVLFVAFNRHTVADLKEKLPPNVDCYTLHSLGSKSIYSAYNEVSMKEGKQIDYLEPIFSREKDNRKKWSSIYESDRLLSLVRATMTSLDNESITKLANNHNLFPDEDIVNATLRAGLEIKRYNEEERNEIVIDFQDMIGIPATNRNIRTPQYDYVMVDEAQDCSKLDQLLIERLIKPVKGRLIAVGDSRQSIYSFRGADIDSFEYFVNRPNTVKLPLTVSYRCGKRIVKEASEIWPEIEAWEENLEGEVERVKDVEKVQKGDMIICRNLRPLIDAFIKLLDQDKKCTIVGKELTEGLLKLIENEDDSGNIEQLHRCTDLIKKELEDKLKARGMSNLTDHPRMVSLQEKIDVLHVLGDRCESIGELKSMIERIFSDDSISPIRLSTIHKAKGKESERVFVITHFQGKRLIPSPYAVTPDQLIQERNLEFVSVTRAKKSLFYLEL